MCLDKRNQRGMSGQTKSGVVNCQTEWCRARLNIEWCHKWPTYSGFYGLWIVIIMCFLFQQRTKKDVSGNYRDESSDLADPTPSMSHFGKAKKLAEKQRAARLVNSTDGVSSPFASPPGKAWEEDDSLPCNIIAMHRSKLSKSAKRFLSNSRLTDEPDTRSSFAGEILECDSETGFTAEREEKESNGRVDNNSGGSPITGCSSNNNTTDLSEHRTSPPVLQPCSSPVVHPNGYSENGHEGQFTGVNRSKRKASGSLEDGRNKRRLIVGDTADELENNSLVSIL